MFKIFSLQLNFAVQYEQITLWTCLTESRGLQVANFRANLLLRDTYSEIMQTYTLLYNTSVKEIWYEVVDNVKQ